MRLSRIKIKLFFQFLSIFISFKIHEKICNIKFFIKFFIDFFKCKKYKKQNRYLKNLHIKIIFVFRLFFRTTI